MNAHSSEEAPAQVLRPQLPEDWRALLAPAFEQPYMHTLKKFLVAEKAQHTVYPPGAEIFAAFWQTPLSALRVVILGQDPYHGPGQAHGLSFSVNRGQRVPPSLENIFRELNQSLGLPRPAHGDLRSWASQGVLLLNAVLTVRARQANSHRGQGWETFTDFVIRQISAHCEGLVFLLWGSAAGKKSALIDGQRHLILKAPHPSPLSAHRGFLGCGHFAQANAYLQATGRSAIDWSLPQ